MIQYTCTKQLPVYKSPNKTESVKQKVPSGIIYFSNYLLHLDPGISTIGKYHDTTVNIRRCIILLLTFSVLFLRFCIFGQPEPSEPSHPYSHQGPVVHSIVSLTSSLRVISLNVLADSIYNILIFFAEKL